MSDVPNPFRGGDGTRPWYLRWRTYRLALVLAVLVAIGAFLLPPKFCACDRTLLALRSDLKNLVVAEKTVFDSTAQYSRDLAALRFRPSEGVVVSVDTVTSTGYRAHARPGSTRPAWWPGSRDRWCVVWAGDSSLAVPFASQAQPHCVRR